MTIQLESNGLLDDDPSAPLGPDPAQQLRPLDRNLPLLSSPSLASGASSSAAQKALNQLATRPRAFAFAAAAKGAPRSIAPPRDEPMDDDDIEELLRMEEEEQRTQQQQRAHASYQDPDEDEEAELLAQLEQQEQGRQLAGRPSGPASGKRAAIELEDLLGMTGPQAAPSEGRNRCHSNEGNSSSSDDSTMNTNTNLNQSSAAPGNDAGPLQQPHRRPPSSLSAMQQMQAQLDLEAQLDLASCAQAGPSSANRSAASATASSSTSASIPKYIPAGFAYATSFEGREVRFERRKRLKGWKPPPTLGDTRVEDLLACPIYRLRERIEAEKALRVVERHEAAAEAAAAAAASAGGQGRSRTRNGEQPSLLWVDRYRPRKFTELLGDERLHRDVLGWLKEWDECVFKRKNLRRQRHQQYLENKYNSNSNSNSNRYGDGGSGNGGEGGAREQQWKDPYGRPNERVLMVSGPPGLGKTTLAHVIAEHAGYNVFELNASDARTAGAVEDLIRMALESGSLKDPRPTLVVIDEIDGATGGGGGAATAGGGEGAGFVRALVRLIENGKGTHSKTAGGGGKRKAKKGHKPLLRPIICICNDVYAPSLRPLRALAKLVRFQAAPTNVVVKRLRDICDAEGVEADRRGLSLLAELTGGDLRACINALEFAKRKRLDLTEAAVRKAAVGIKDTGTTVQRVWEMLFRTQSRKEKVRASTRGRQAAVGGGEGAAAMWNQQDARSSAGVGAGGGKGGVGGMAESVLVDTPQENVQRLMHEITSCGEYDKLAQGCFEHYPRLRASDDGWKRYRSAHDWLHFGEAMRAQAWSMGWFELLGYQAWSFVAWYGLFAKAGNALPDYPKAEYEMRLRATAYLEVASALHASLPVSLRSRVDRRAVLLEVGPALLRILTPELRGSSNAIVSMAERQRLARLVEVMLALNVRLVQDRGEGDSTALVWKLEPPIEVFGQFEARAMDADRARNRYAVRAMVARELEKERSRRALVGDERGGGGERGEAGAEGGKRTAEMAMSVYRNGGQRAVQLDARETQKVARDFFGRVIAPKPATMAAAASAVGVAAKRKDADPADGSGAGASGRASWMQQQEAGTQAPLKVFYRYHEGFSNAVRRPVKMSYFL
ncbi:Chromosome transmission fidelity protein 18 [Thecaphora frezii]